MSILCSLFGHKPPVYAANQLEQYAYLNFYKTDKGVIRHYVYAECPRCHYCYIVALLHTVNS